MGLGCRGCVSQYVLGRLDVCFLLVSVRLKCCEELLVPDWSYHKQLKLAVLSSCCFIQTQ